ncbi:hypothetical protein GJ496_010246 [Pomphorhynchus laevis]|nr:hypothetical protein GJ496_010246 [Pomphorhynchus laevis]
MWKYIGSPTLKPADNLRAFGGSNVDVAGDSMVVCKHRGQTRRLQATVSVQDHEALFGLPWTIEFRLPAQAQIVEVFAVEESNSNARLDPVVTEFRKIFEEKAWKISNYEANLHIAKEVNPVRWSARRIPFVLRDKVKDEIDRMVIE